MGINIETLEWSESFLCTMVIVFQTKRYSPLNIKQLYSNTARGTLTNYYYITLKNQRTEIENNYSSAVKTVMYGVQWQNYVCLSFTFCFYSTWVRQAFLIVNEFFSPKLTSISLPGSGKKT